MDTLTVTSTAFKHEERIPEKYTCDGTDISPSLHWANVPEKTKSFVVIMDDPDAPVGTWDHWIVYNITAEIQSLPEAASSEKKLPPKSIEGINSWKRNDYGGPCPPGGTHRYFFRVYALDAFLDIAPQKATRKNVIDAMKGHVLASGELMGKYSR